MAIPNILIQLDTDEQVSTFDSVVAIDSNVDHLLRHNCVEPLAVRELVHGAMFTRGGDALKNTAIFVGGSDILDGEEVFDAVRNSFFGPVRVSVMLDSGGCNTTASAAVLAAASPYPTRGCHCLGAGRYRTGRRKDQSSFSEAGHGCPDSISQARSRRENLREHRCADPGCSARRSGNLLGE